MSQLQQSTLNSMLNIRKATQEDIPFLTRTHYEATLPPLNHCMWDDLLLEMGTETLTFLETCYRLDAIAWGRVEDFTIVSENGKPVAAATGYEPNQDDYRILKLAHLEQVAEALGWTDTATANFRAAYEQFFGTNPRDIVFAPQAPWIIEIVAVVKEARGRGLGKILLQALQEEGKLRGHSHAGIMVINGNEVARRTYESVGFKWYSAFSAEYFDNKFSGLTKFRMSLI